MDNDKKLCTITGVSSIKIPKEIAKITLCGAVTLIVTDMMDWIPPTEEQRKNLKEMLCVDVEVLA